MSLVYSAILRAYVYSPLLLMSSLSYYIWATLCIHHGMIDQSCTVADMPVGMSNDHMMKRQDPCPDHPVDASDIEPEDEDPAQIFADGTGRLRSDNLRYLGTTILLLLWTKFTYSSNRRPAIRSANRHLMSLLNPKSHPFQYRMSQNSLLHEILGM